MSKRTNTVAATVEGRIDRIRLAVPLVRGHVHFQVNGEPVNATFEDQADIRTLRGLQQQATPVRVGVLEGGPPGLRHFSWLNAGQGRGIPPRYYVDQRRRGWRGIGISLAVAAVAGAGASLLDLSSFAQVLLLVLALTVALVAVLLAGFSLYGLWDNRRHRAAILRSEALYRDLLDTPVPDAAPAAQAPAAHPLDEGETLLTDAAPEILLIRGALASLTHEARPSARTTPSYGVYRFHVGTRRFIMYVAENFGDVLPFLAEGDRVEVAAYAGQIAGAGPDQLVYGLRNLEDGRVYVCHHYFRAAFTDIAPVGVGLRQRVPMLSLLAILLLVCWLVVVAVLSSSDSPSGREAAPELAAVTFVFLLVAWLCVALPLLFLDTRWRMGRPTRRQRILERIYRALNLGTPFAPTAVIEEV
ncbi:hypothetical protein [Achromobacter xylosoxidans]|uniref:Uncharacterized protein n=1 Tax=Alcaligenes xylosoxydans xylosoxydans TaxID=85698 RepID=A0A1R1JY72_ALCXX|nr:hypothetical protein [Achromobacter xylosoxidans]OMG91501.1 hypothetical protein BIZ92_19485 [Achromobacter xylosoxidans]BEG73352.1 hypothetical protein HBIAX_00395 [Achromobacter xylosoxidans]